MTSRPGKDFLAAEAATLAAGVSAVIASPEYQVILRRRWSKPWQLNSTDHAVNPLPRVPCLQGGDDTDLFSTATRGHRRPLVPLAFGARHA